MSASSARRVAARLDALRPRRRPAPPTLDELGVAAQLPQSSLERDVLRPIEAAIDAAFGTAVPRRIAVIANENPVRLGSVLTARYPEAEVLLLDARRTGRIAEGPNRTAPRLTTWRAGTVAAMHEALSTVAGLDVLIDADPSRKALKAGGLRYLLLHLRAGGLFVVGGLESLRDPELLIGGGLDVWQVAGRLMRLRLNPALLPLGGRDDGERARAAAVASISTDGRVIAVRKAGEHALKLRDEPAEVVLAGRRGDAWGLRLDTQEPVVVRSRATLTTNALEATFPTEYAVPRLYLREYRDVVCAPRQLVVQGDVILPVSFHHGLRHRLPQESPLVHHAGNSFAVLDPALRVTRDLPGPYFHLDSEFPSHFGHLMTEDIAKTWAWPAAVRAYPDIRVLVSADEPGGRLKDHHVRVFAALGIAPGRITCIDRPVRVERLLGASQMFYNPLYVHPAMSEVWDLMRENLGSPEQERTSGPERIFVARSRQLRRACRNAAEVEALFVEHGFTVVHPEQLSLREQVDLFAGAEFVAGYGGSGMFNTVYARRPGRRVVIASENYVARNEWMIASLKGDDYHHFVCDADEKSPDGRVAHEQFHSSYAFDFARDGAALEALLKE